MRHNHSVRAALIALLCGGPMMTTAVPGHAQDAAVAALRSYYATLAQPLPVAPAGALLDERQLLTRIAFGSCSHQDRPQDYWTQIATDRPDLFLMIGDNVYGDIRQHGHAALPTLVKAYARQAAQASFAAFRAQVPMLATWDDHDYGLNDAGGDFAFKEQAERIFENFWQSDADVRERPGVHDSVVIGPKGKRVQIILLDTRFFRSALQEKPYQDPAPPLGWWTASTDPQATMLGDAQWQWLETQLATPADVRLIISSVQVLTNANDFEKWANFPAERARLMQMLARTGNSVILSGDRHQAGVYHDVESGLREITSSSLNLAFDNRGRAEPDPMRVTDQISTENYGMIDIDWRARQISLSVKASHDRQTLIAPVSVPFGAKARRIP